MRMFSAALLGAFCLLAVTACGPSKPPLGRWEGTYESAHTMIAARLEIDRGGVIYISAPNALDIGPNQDRAAIRVRLALDLARAWDEVAPRHFTFDGTTFRKPGGIAPQLEWDPDSKTMTMIVYPGTRPTVRVPMRKVRKFSSDPWPADSDSR